MPRRVTATEKWDDPWYRRLKPTQKCFWLWLTDHCDLAGVVDVDMEAARFQVGAKVSLDDFEGRVVPLPNGKYFIVGFIRFQQGRNVVDLDTKNNAHLSILKSIEKNGITAEILSVNPLALRDVSRNSNSRVDVNVETPSPIFLPPTIAEVEEYMASQMQAVSRRCPGITKVVFPAQEAPKFMGHWNQVEWKIKGKLMKNWKQTAYNWLINANKFNRGIPR